MTGNFPHQDLLHYQPPALSCLARVYDVVGTSVGPVHRVNVGMAGIPDHCPADTFAPPLQHTAPEPDHRQVRIRWEEDVGERHQGSFVLGVLEQDQPVGRRLGCLGWSNAVSPHRSCVDCLLPSSELSILFGSL